MNRYLAVRQHLRYFPEWSSTQGIPQFGLAKRRVCCSFWLVAALIATGLLLWQIVLAFQSYYQWGVTVNIELFFEQREFPAITVCNSNPYKYSLIGNYPMLKRLMDTYKYSAKKMVCGWRSSCEFTVNSTLDDYANEYLFSTSNNTGQLRFMASSLVPLAAAMYDMSEAMITKSDLILGCSFNTQPCSDSDWDEYTDPYLGRCYQFNLNSNYTSYRSGPTYGLRLQLKTNNSEYLPTSNAASVVMMVHDQDEDVIPGSVGYNIPVGTRTTISVTYQVTSRLSSPYGDCSDDKPTNYLYNKSYSTEMCQRSEYQYMIVDNCNCYDPAFPNPGNNTNACTMNDSLSCWLQYSNQSAGLDCHQPCNQGTYSTTLSSGTWPTLTALFVANCYPLDFDDNCNSIFGNNSAMVDIYYEKLNYETLTESPAVTMSTTLSNIGGMLGLWLGMSLISLVEFVILFIQVFLSLVAPNWAYFADF